MTTSCMGPGFHTERSRRVKPAAALPPADLPASKARHMARRAVEDARPPCTAGPSATARSSTVSATGVRASSRSTTRATSRCDPPPTAAPASTCSTWCTTSSGAACARRCWCASPTSSPAACSGLCRRVRAAPSRSTATRAATAACTRSRSTSSATSSRRSSSSARRYDVGLEAGSKPELLVALALLDTPDALIICNGYKDRAYIETALLAQRLGRTPIIVVDRFHELDLIIKTSRELGIRPHIGVRARLTHQGRRQVGRVDRRPLEVRPHRGRDRRGRRPAARRGHARLPRAAALPHRLADHRHPRPQGRAARGEPHLRRAARDGRDAALHRRRRRPRRRLRRLADQLPLVDELHRAGVRQRRRRRRSRRPATSEGIPHPDIVTEAGRAMVAHHSVLVFDVLGVNEMLSGKPPEPVQRRRPQGASRTSPRCGPASRSKNVQEAYHDALQLKEEAATLFSLGYLDLRAARARRAAVLGLLREDPAHRARAALRARGPRAAREGPGRHLLRQLLGLPVGARPLGGEAALPGHADPPPRREADAARRLRRPHLRQRRQDRPVHRPARREGRPRAAPAERRSRTTSACSWSAPTRRSSATCTTSSATPTPCTCASTRDGGYAVEHVVEGDSVDRGAALRAVRPRHADREGAPHHRDRAARRRDHPRGVAPACAGATSRACRSTPTWSATSRPRRPASGPASPV